MTVFTMKRPDRQSKPIPGYIQVSGCEIYVTYQGQVITSKYCSDVGHIQSECHKLATDFPALTRCKPCESSTAVPVTNAHLEPVNSSKKKRFHKEI